MSVESMFLRQLDRGWFPGGQLVVRVGGEAVLDLAVGVARGGADEEHEPVTVTSKTLFQVMSASKPVVAFSVAVLDDRGLVDVSRPVSEYIPEFGRAGKGEITVLDVLTHRAGVQVPRLWREPGLWTNWQRVQEEIWRTPPRYRPGTLCYQPWEFGAILAESVRRVAGQPLPDFTSAVLPGLGAELRFLVKPDASIARVAVVGRRERRRAWASVHKNSQVRGGFWSSQLFATVGERCLGQMGALVT